LRSVWMTKQSQDLPREPYQQQDHWSCGSQSGKPSAERASKDWICQDGQDARTEKNVGNRQQQASESGFAHKDTLSGVPISV
jgi:hypothetical protein